MNDEHRGGSIFNMQKFILKRRNELRKNVLFADGMDNAIFHGKNGKKDCVQHLGHHYITTTIIK